MKSNQNDNNKKNQNIDELLGNCRSVWIFTKLNELGEGTYGTVCTVFYLNAYYR